MQLDMMSETMPTPVQTRTRSTPLALGWLAAALAFGSELLHLYELPDEFLTWPVRGVFFLLVSVAQGALSVNLLFRPGRWMLRLGIALNVFLIVIWVFTRAVGVPSWITFVRQPVDAVGVSAVALQAALIVLLVWMNRTRRR